MKRIKHSLLLFGLLLSLFMVFSYGVSAETPTLPDYVYFFLDEDPTKVIEMTPAGEVELQPDPDGYLEGLGLENLTAKIFTLEIPYGSSFSLGLLENAPATTTSRVYSAKWTIIDPGRDTQVVDPATRWSIPQTEIYTSLDKCYILAHKANKYNTVSSIYLFYCIQTGDAPDQPDPVLTDFKAGSIANYVGNTSSATVGATFENVENDTPVKFYVTDKENGTSEEAIEGTLMETTAEKVLPNRSDVVVPTGELEAGQYWLAAEVGDSRMYQPFTMYATAREYAEAMLEAMIRWNQTTGFYRGDDYVGLADGIDGNDWYAYIFGALGYESDDPLLTSADGTTYLDYMADALSRHTEESLVEEDSSSPAAKRLGRMILGITGMGGDPRDIGGKNLVKSLISIAYEDYDIEGGSLRLDDDGSLHVRLADTDPICEGYFLTALEAVNATPEEGYTEELRRAGLKTLINTGEKALNGSDGSGYQNGKNISDFYSMTLFAAEFLNDVEGMEGEAKKLLDDFEAYYASVIANPENEMNLFSVAMATTVIVGNGVDFEKYTADEKWRHPYGGWELAKLLGTVNQDGYTGARMAQYEVMQGLADILNGKTCFRLAHEKYSETYPQYTDEGQEVANQLKALPEEITDAEDIAAVNEARAAYEDFMAGFSEKVDTDSVEAYYADLEAALGEAEEACVEYVEEAIAAIGEVTLDDADAIAAAREAFDALTDEQKELVANGDELIAAEEALAAAIVAADEAAAKAVDDAIAAIGEVTLNDAEAIAAARAAYDALTDAQKALVENEEVLKEAEAVLAELVKEAANPFEDVKSGDYFFDAVLWAVENDITKGTDKTHFSPANKCSRGQIVTFLWRAAGEPDVAAKNPFGDVKEGAYYYEAVLWAVENGITTGTGKTTFSPDASCTRSQIVTFLWRAAGSPEVGGDNPFNDVKADAYYYNAVLWAVDQGITTGATPKTFAPDKVCSRGEAVTFLFRAQ